MAEFLVDLPAGTQRDMVMAGFKKMMDGLLPLQVTGGTDDGMWRQVLDLASAPVESSCTAMFTFALTTAVKNGWLTDPKYAAAARRGWIAVANKTNAQGRSDRVCPATGAAPSGTLASQQSFYTSITLGGNDLHGQAPLLWAAHALLRNDCPGMR
jgi:rhamnogalacturonyl hydrolase YesR